MFQSYIVVVIITIKLQKTHTERYGTHLKKNEEANTNLDFESTLYTFPSIGPSNRIQQVFHATFP